MATAQTIINRAMRLIGALESGESPTADETADVLVALNQMIDSWRNDRLTVYQLVDYTHTLVAATSSYTIGSGATINQERPVKIEDARIRDAGTDTMIEIIDKQSFNRFSDTTSTSNYPLYLYYEPSYPSGTIRLWPIPNAANTLVLTVWQPITTLATAATSISLPPGYERALTYNLAVDIAPEFQQQVPPAVAEIAINSLAALKRVNIVPITAQVEFAMGRSYDIMADV